MLSDFETLAALWEVFSEDCSPLVLGFVSCLRGNVQPRLELACCFYSNKAKGRFLVGCQETGIFFDILILTFCVWCQGGKLYKPSLLLQTEAEY